MGRQFTIKEEVLRYLGYKGQVIDDHMDKIIEDTIDEIKILMQPRYLYKKFDISDHENKVYLDGTGLHLPGEDIKRHLEGSKACILMAATLGHEVDRKIRYYEKIDMTKAVILDAVATAFIEKFCHNICEEIEFNLIKIDEKLTSRYSPGYGDLPIELQKDFVRTLDLQKTIGLNVSSTSTLLPRKSVTAIVGVIDKDESKEQRTCIDCNKYDDCNFSKGGKGYEYQTKAGRWSISL